MCEVHTDLFMHNIFEMLKTVKTSTFDFLKIVSMIIIPRSEQTLRKIVY